jgi:hypothetical protein
MIFIKGTVSRDFRPSVFSSINTPGPPDSWAKATMAKAVSNINSYSRRYSIMKIDSALCSTARSRLGAMHHSAESTPRYETVLRSCIIFKWLRIRVKFVIQITKCKEKLVGAGAEPGAGGEIFDKLEPESHKNGPAPQHWQNHHDC